MAEASLDHGGPDPTLDLPGCEGLTESTFYDKVLSVDDMDVGPEALEERLAEIRRLRQVAVTTVAEMLDRTTGAAVLAALLGRGTLPEGFNLLA